MMMHRRSGAPSALDVQAMGLHKALRRDSESCLNPSWKFFKNFLKNIVLKHLGVNIRYERDFSYSGG